MANDAPNVPADLTVPQLLDMGLSLLERGSTKQAVKCLGAALEKLAAKVAEHDATLRHRSEP